MKIEIQLLLGRRCYNYLDPSNPCDDQIFVLEKKKIQVGENLK
jgi:hypothetical protein